MDEAVERLVERAREAADYLEEGLEKMVDAGDLLDEVEEEERRKFIDELRATIAEVDP